MPSERRLHPLSILFSIGKQFGALAVPLAVVVIGAGSDEDRWSLLALIGLVPYAAVMVGQYLTFRYRYEDSELVIRRGLIFRNQRHVPYDRIQNIDAVQNVLHRLTGLVEVQIQTGAGSAPEATLSVLTLADLDEMRRRVFGARLPAAATATVPELTSPPVEQVLLRLPPRELVIYGIIENRGMIVIAAAFGLMWQFSAIERLFERFVGGQASRGFMRRAARMIYADGGPSVRAVMYGVAGLALFLLVSRIFSIAWALVRLHGFTLVQTGEDLRAQYGLLTRVTATIPRRRIQSVTVSESPLHRLFGRASVRVATAGGGAGDTQKLSEHREWLAPIIPRQDVPALVAKLLPGVEVDGLDWRGVHPRAFRRVVNRGLAVAVLPVGLAWLFLGPVGLWLLPVLAIWTVIRARLYVSRLGWTMTPAIAAFREGALVRMTTLVLLAKIQCVTRHESPFDRRAAMARVRVDAAGGGADMPYLPAAIADGFSADLIAAAARTAFQW